MNDELKPGDIVELLNMNPSQAEGLSDPMFYIGMRFKILKFWPVGSHSGPRNMYELDGFAPNDYLFHASQLLKIELKSDKNLP